VSARDLSLNPQQDAAVRHPAARSRARRAGFGQDARLTARIVALIRERAWRRRAFSRFTFTNKAAGEMRARVAALLGADPRGVGRDVPRLSARLLRREAALLGFGPNFTIYDQDDSESFIKRLLEQRGHSPKPIPRARSTQYLGREEPDGPPEELGASADSPLERCGGDLCRASARRSARPTLWISTTSAVSAHAVAEHPERPGVLAAAFRSRAGG